MKKNPVDIINKNVFEPRSGVEEIPNFAIRNRIAGNGLIYVY